MDNLTRKQKVTRVPEVGEVIKVMTNRVPPAQTLIEFTRGSQTVAVGVVAESTNPHVYEVLVIAKMGGRYA